MGLGGLFFGLILPWCAGVVWLRFFHLTDKGPVKNSCYYLGYGLLIGYFLVYFILMSGRQLDFELSFFSVIFVLLALFLLPLFFLIKRGIFKNNIVEFSAIKNDLDVMSLGERLLILVLILAIFAHLLMAFLEVIWQPLYPWDAWTTWAFKAKVLFESGLDTVFVAPSLKADGDAYTLPAFHYPLFVPLMQYWAVLSLGEWHESFVNLPAYLFSLAIGLGLYGQARNFGMPMVFALFISYAFFSVPLIDSHIALGGYADIWLAGYLGLGLIAVLSGKLGQHYPTMVLGFSLILVGALIKNEGLLWLLLSIALLVIISVRIKILLVVFSVAISVLGLALWLNNGLIDIPGLGHLGVRGKFLYLPIIGRNDLLFTNNVAPIFNSLFILGNWNLLWLAVLVASIFSVNSWQNKAYQFLIILLALMTITFFVIFFLTGQGDYAKSFTAVNRLFLHFSVVFIFIGTYLVSQKFIRPAVNGRK